MLTLATHEGVARVYFELSRHPEWLWPDNPECRLPNGLAEKLYRLSGDVVTTVWMLIIWQEAFVARDFVDSVDIHAVVADFRNHAGSEDAARDLLAEEVDGIIEKAVLFGERISNMIDNGVIVRREPVERYCREQLERMLEAWLQYRVKLQAVVGIW